MLRLYNGDCLQVLKDISSNSVDLIICDLPFGCLEAQRKGKATEKEVEEYGKGRMEAQRGGCAWDIKIDLEAFWKEIKRVRRNEHTPCLHFTTTKYGFDLFNSNPKEFRYDLVWDKGRGVSFLSANKMPMRSHEMVYVFSKAGAYYNRVDISGEAYIRKRKESINRQYGETLTTETVNTGSRCVKSVIQNPNKTLRKSSHPTAKPIDLYRFLIERYCPVGGTVLDPTFGSGNSGKAAKELQRKYIGIEQDKTFFEKAKKILLPEENVNP